MRKVLLLSGLLLAAIASVAFAAVGVQVVPQHPMVFKAMRSALVLAVVVVAKAKEVLDLVVDVVSENWWKRFGFWWGWDTTAYSHSGQVGGFGRPQAEGPDYPAVKALTESRHRTFTRVRFAVYVSSGKTCSRL